MKRLMLAGLVVMACGCADRNNPDPMYHPQQAAAVNLEKQNALLTELLEVEKQRNAELVKMNAHLSRISVNLEGKR